ncbi:hypothetical protein ONE63_003855 [Megalurothrips usitatus]|uniref:Uncharacterized protein n=1 Tax=Megalurothrips usitatus TaxID=439358 RepID=A0AAV7X6X0_9NEOP|nr:hypothetical protein ONE63_003855 [Megalurothrips usitatus]
MKVLECVLLQVAGVLVLCWLCEAAAGGCSRYGHACWGGHGKRSSRPAKVLPLPMPVPLQVGDVRDMDMDAAETSEAAQDADEGEVQQAEAADGGGGGARRPFTVGGYGLNPAGDLVPLPNKQALQLPDAADESDEDVHRARSQGRRRHKSREDDVQVLLIPDEDSALSDLRVYQILGHTPRKRV